MKKRYVLVGLVAVLTLSLVVPALGGPSNPIAQIAGLKKQVKKNKRAIKKNKKRIKKAKKKANKANQNANGAQSSADAAQSSANSAQSTANSAKSTADSNAAKLSCPAATTLIAGICVEDAVRTAADYFAAEDVCQVAGLFLPGVDTLMHYLHKTDKDPGTMATPAEWTYERIDAANSSKVNLVGGIPRHESEAIGSALPFRCATYAG